MRFFFIDYENTHMSGLEGLENITDNDFIYLFYNPKDTFPLKYMKPEILSRIEFVEAYVGTANSLDFQLISWVGYKISDPYVREFIIVSKDNGYKSAAQFWQDKGYNVRVVHNINQDIITLETTQAQKIKDSAKSSVESEEEFLASYTFSNEDIKTFQYIENAYPLLFKGISVSEIMENMAIVKKVFISSKDQGKRLNKINNALTQKYKNSETQKQHYKYLKNCITLKNT